MPLQVQTARPIIVAVSLMLGLSGCAASPRFLPAVDSGTAHAEAETQRSASARIRGDLVERVRQLGSNPAAGVSDYDRLSRVQPVAERLFAAALPFCRQQGLPCNWPVLLENNATLNAHANNRHISISRPMVDLAETDDQLALVLGHELAHVVLGHTRRDMGDQLGRAFDSRRDKDDERQADYVGLYLAARAGYAPVEAARLWRRMGMAQPQIIQGDKVHPGTAERYVALRQAAAEIEAKRTAGQPLMPGR